MAIVFNSKYVREPITDSEGTQLGVAIYNPKDAGIADRYLKYLPLLEEIMKEADAGRISTPEGMQEVFAKCRQFADMVFSPGFYDNAFAHVSPLAVGEDGSIFYVDVIQAIVEKITAEAKRSASAKAKYLQA